MHKIGIVLMLLTDFVLVRNLMVKKREITIERNIWACLAKEGESASFQSSNPSIESLLC